MVDPQRVDSAGVESAAPAARPDPLRGRQRAAVLLLLAGFALLPFGRAAELPILLAAVCGVALAVRGGVDWQAPSVRLALLLFAAYWLPELVSAPDALQPARAWREVASDLRYLPMLLFACCVLRSAPAQQLAKQGCGWIVALWLGDALLQAATGLSLGGPSSPDRLSGIFGADDLKLGSAVAVLSPFLLLPAFARSRLLGALAALLVVMVVLLAGTRSAWIGTALVLAACLWRAYGGGRAALFAVSLTLLASCSLAALGYVASERFALRIERSAAALTGAEGLDHALSGRLPIWSTALRMFREHPINGVGVRGFRTAYSDYAAEDDPWRGFDGESGAFHAHQLLLEVTAETGAFGLLCWVLAGLVAVRVWREAAPAARRAAGPVSLALLALLFPFNTHYAFYSSAWGGLLFGLLALWLPMVASTARERGAPAKVSTAVRRPPVGA